MGRGTSAILDLTKVFQKAAPGDKSEGIYFPALNKRLMS